MSEQSTKAESPNVEILNDIMKDMHKQDKQDLPAKAAFNLLVGNYFLTEHSFICDESSRALVKSIIAAGLRFLNEDAAVKVWGETKDAEISAGNDKCASETMAKIRDSE